jgi:large subunit ribosomal protein L25
MRSIAIEGKQREDLGSKSARALRKEGLVPCVIYGTGENIHFSTEVTSFKDILYTAEALLIEVTLDGGKQYKTVVRDWQFHPVTDELLHCDFYHFAEGKEITIDVPVKLIGSAKGVRNGGRLKVNLRKLPVKATLENMPGVLELNIEELRIGEALRVEDIDTGGFEIMRESSRTILTIQTSRNVVALDDEEDETEEGEEGEEATTEEAAEA